MSELYPSDAELNALSGLSDAQQEVPYIAIGESPYYTSFYKMLYRLLDVSRRSGDLRVYKDGDLTFGMRAGKISDGAIARDIAAVAMQNLTNNATNFIYLACDGTLAVNIIGFPSPAVVPHIPLATIVTTQGGYSHQDISDLRGRAMFRALSGMTPASENQLITATPSLAFTVGAESAASQRTIAIQLQDVLGNALPGRFKVRIWISTSDFGTPDAADKTVSIIDGTVVRELLANGDYEVATTSDGMCSVGVTAAGEATCFILAEVGGRIYSTGAISWGA